MRINWGYRDLSNEEVDEIIQRYTRIVAKKTVKDYKLTYVDEYPDRLISKDILLMFDWEEFEEYEREFFIWQFLPENLETPLPSPIVKAMSFKYRRLLAQFYLERHTMHEDYGSVFDLIEKWFSTLTENYDVNGQYYDRTEKHVINLAGMLCCKTEDWEEYYYKEYGEKLPDIINTSQMGDEYVDVYPYHIFWEWGADRLPLGGIFFDKDQIQSIQKFIYLSAEHSFAIREFTIDNLVTDLNSDLDSRYDTGWILDGGPWKWLYEKRTYLNSFLRCHEDPQMKEYDFKTKQLYNEYKKYLEYDPLPSEDLDLEKEEEYDKKVEEYYKKVKELDQKYLGI